MDTSNAMAVQSLLQHHSPFTILPHVKVVFAFCITLMLFVFVRGYIFTFLSLFEMLFVHDILPTIQKLKANINIRWGRPSVEMRVNFSWTPEMKGFVFGMLVIVIFFRNNHLPPRLVSKNKPNQMKILYEEFVQQQ